MSDDRSLEVMVFVANPADFTSWPLERKIARYTRLMTWHEYISTLSPTTLPQVWGTSQVLSQTRLSPIQNLNVLVYRVESLAEFDAIMYNDPLREFSDYTTIMLTELSKDREDDIKRLDRARKELANTDDALKILEQQRALFRSEPDYVGKYTMEDPENPLVGYFRSIDDSDERPLEVLILGQNPPEYMSWDDARKLIHYEKVIWWHDHIAQMLHEGRVSHVWGTHDFCDLGLLSYRSASAVTVYRAKDLDEFDDTYRLDPLRDHGRFWSMILKPIVQQRELDEMRLKHALSQAT